MKKKLFTFFLFSALLFAKEHLLLFSGNKELSSKELYSVLELHKPYFYEFYVDEPVIEFKNIELTIQALKDYYKSKGFYHTNISYLKDKNSITLLIEENNPIIVKSVTFISNLDISKEIPFKEGEIFSADKFTRSKKDIKLLYANSHFCNASLDAKAWIDIEQNFAYLAYEVIQNKRCYFGNIEIIPTKNIDADILKSLIYFEEGEPFSTNKITRSYESLYGYEGISKSIINTNIKKNNRVDITINTIENEKPVRFMAGLGASSDEGVMFFLGIKHRNFLGNLKSLGAETRVTQIKQTIKTNFDMPLINKNFTGFEVGYENEDFITFKEERIFADLFLKQKVSSYTTFKESILFDKARTYDINDETLFPKSSLFVVSPKLEWNYDTRDKILDPRSGYFINSQISGSVKSAVSDASYYKFKLNGGYILPINDYIVGLKATFGTLSISDGYIPSSYRFFAGGMYSNRAYGYRKLGPTDDKNNPIGSDSIIETTAEVRFNIYKDLRGVLFSDTTFLGNDSTPNYDNGYYSAGFGLRYNTPVGPIAIDAGFDIENPMKQYAIHFHIGELF